MRRPSILPRNQLNGLGHNLSKDASVDIIATQKEVSKYLKSRDATGAEDERKVVFKDDLQIVHPVGVDSLVS